MPIFNRDLLAVLKDTAEFLEASEVAQTPVGIQAYIQAQILNKKIVELQQEIDEEDAYIDLLAEKYGG
jgi:hypothetical protein